MPAKKTRDTLTRQWELLKILPATGSGKTVRQLTHELNALGFRVENRQMERNLKQLQDSMPIECNVQASRTVGVGLKGLRIVLLRCLCPKHCLGN